MGKFTAGPWKISGESGNPGEAFIIEADDKTIAWTANTIGEEDNEIITEEDRANAHLMAACPDMFEACRHAAQSYHHPACKAQGKYAGQPERYCTCHVQKARAALEKAEIQ